MPNFPWFFPASVTVVSCLLFASFITLAVSSGQLPAQERNPARSAPSENADGDWPFETPEPGVRIYGQQALFPGLTHYDLSPDGQYFVGFRGLRMMVWNRPENRLLKEVEVLSLGKIIRTRFSPRGKYLAILLQRWEPVAETLDEFDGENPLPADSLEAFFNDQPQTRNLLLVYNRRWEVEWEFDVDLELEQLDFFDPVKIAPDESSLLLQGHGQTIVFDLDQGHVLKRQPSVGPAVYLSASRIAWPQQRLVWNWARDLDEPMPEDMLTDVGYVLAHSHDSDWLLISGTRGYAVVHLPTGRRIDVPARSVSGASFSPDSGDAVVLAFDAQLERQMVLLDLDQGEEVARVKAPLSSTAWFITGENQILIDVVNYGGSTRSAVTSFHLIPLGEGFEAGIQSVRQQAPRTDHVSFANRDQVVVLANGRASFDLTNGKLTIGDFEPNEVQEMAVDPQSDRIYTVGESKRQLSAGSFEIHRRSVTSPDQKSLVQISPPPPVVESFGRLFGARSPNTWVISPVHLSVSKDGSRVRILHEEIKVSVERLDDILERRFVYTQYDVESGQRLPGTRLEFPKVDSKAKWHFDLSPDGQFYGFAQGTVLAIGETADGKLQQEIDLPGMASQVRFSHDNRWVAVGLDSPSWRVLGWGPFTYGRPLADQVIVIERATGAVPFHKRRLEVVAFEFHPVKHQLFLVERNGDTGDKQVTFYNETTWDVAFQHRSSHGQPLAAALSHDGNSVAFPLSDSRIEVWNLSDLQTHQDQP